MPGHPVHVHRGHPQPVSGLNVVEEALSDMQDGADGHVQPLQSQLEVARSGLVAACLLRGDDLIKLDPEPALGRGKQIVVHIGDHGQPVARLQDAEGVDGVVEGRPARDRLGKRSPFPGAGDEAQLVPEFVHHTGQHIPVRAVESGLEGRLEAREALQNPGSRKLSAMGGQYAPERLQNPAFPIDERPVAVEGENFEG